VSDTGAGMTPDVLARAFEPFFTTKGVGKGSGLGLSMVYGFVKQSGGHAKIYSESGHGTTVRVYLPRAASAATAAVSHAEPPEVGGHEHVLVVEDDPRVREHAVTLLRGLGYRVSDAADGAAALKVLAGPEFVDLLFTDIVMPGGMNGRQLADAARALRPHLRVLYTSGYTENAIVHHGRLDPGVQLLAKPYRRRQLARKVRAVLDGPEPGAAET
jgi:CheY-like chemotaxis protein